MDVRKIEIWITKQQTDLPPRTAVLSLRTPFDSICHELQTLAAIKGMFISPDYCPNNRRKFLSTVLTQPETDGCTLASRFVTNPKSTAQLFNSDQNIVLLRKNQNSNLLPNEKHYLKLPFLAHPASKDYSHTQKATIPSRPQPSNLPDHL